MVEGEQIYGDGVNVAARLESLAEPGGICISATVHEQIRDKLAFGYQDLGDQEVKNIARPVRVYRVLPEAEGPATGKTARRYLRGGVLSIAGLAIIMGTIILVQHVWLKPPHTHASIPPPPTPALALPDKPSIAVLPFSNMSGDPKQDYFSDGLTNDLTSDLSRLPDLFVIASSSAFAYKGKPTKLQNVSRELGVKYVLEGGVRRAADQVRIAVQLADATTGQELWAERYDRPFRDIFALQDEIVRRIVTTLNLQLTLMQEGVLVPRTTQSLEAYDDLLRGIEFLNTLTKDSNAKARQMFENAIRLDPHYALAYAFNGFNYLLGEELLLTPNSNGVELAYQMGQQAIGHDDSLSLAHCLLSGIYARQGQFDRAATEAQRSIALDHNFALGYGRLANVLNNMGKPAEALVAAQRAIRLDPFNVAHYLYEQGAAYTQLGRYEEAIPVFKRDLALSDNLWDHVFLVNAYTEMGQEDDARSEAAEVERRSALLPNSSAGYLALGLIMNFTGEFEQALVAVQKAMNLAPRSADSYLGVEGFAYQGAGRYGDALAAFNRHVAIYPGSLIDHMCLAIDYMELGRDDAARSEAAEVVKLNPQFSPKMFFRTIGRRDKAVAAEARWSADLRKAGLP